jgi:hypothetical protein
MHKVVRVKLDSIGYHPLGNGYTGPIQVTGNIFGATFQNDPNNPHDETERKILYPFPDGPITVSRDTSSLVDWRDVYFPLNDPTAQSERAFPKFLKIAAVLDNGLGSDSLMINDRNELPTDEGEDPPALFRLAFANSIELLFRVSQTSRRDN